MSFAVHYSEVLKGTKAMNIMKILWKFSFKEKRWQLHNNEQDKGRSNRTWKMCDVGDIQVHNSCFKIAPSNEWVICRSWLFSWQLISSCKPHNKGESFRMAAFCLFSTNLSAYLMFKAYFTVQQLEKVTKESQVWWHVNILTIHHIRVSNCHR